MSSTAKDKANIVRVLNEAKEGLTTVKSWPGMFKQSNWKREGKNGQGMNCCRTFLSYPSHTSAFHVQVTHSEEGTVMIFRHGGKQFLQASLMENQILSLKHGKKATKKINKKTKKTMSHKVKTPKHLSQFSDILDE